MKRHPLTGEPVVEPPKGNAFWNGLPTTAERGTAVVADSGAFPRYWAKTEGIVGQRIAVVRVVLDGVNYGGGIEFLDDRDGSGWLKVTEGHGSPAYGHRSVEIEDGSFLAAAANAAVLDAAGPREGEL